MSAKIEVKVYGWNKGKFNDIKDFLNGVDWGEGITFLFVVREVSVSFGWWGKVIKIDKRVAKLVDLSKILLKVEVKEIGFLLASITITSEGVDNQTGIIEMNEGRILISGGRGSHDRLEAMCK